MNRSVNDATLTKLGDLYQYYIALLECFKMNEGEAILIEVFGDISKISKKDSFQMEVKHHIGSDFLNERDVDIWKTLRNWVKDFERIKTFDKLILFTTSEISDNSPFYDWNDKKTEQKLKILNDIGSIVKKREKIFRDYYKKIFVDYYNEENLNTILSRFQIISRQLQFERVEEEFVPYIKYIPDISRRNYVSYLLGMILSKVQDGNYRWEIGCNDFEQIVQESTPLFVKSSSSPLIWDFATLSPSTDYEEAIKDKLFVKAIKSIEYNDEIPKAIKNYWRTNMTILKYYNNNLVFNKSLLNYKNTLREKLCDTKQAVKVEYGESERPVQVKESKKMYSHIMAWDALPFGTINPNQPFFQKGIIHEVVDDGDFTWDVGDKDEH